MTQKKSASTDVGEPVSKRISQVGGRKKKKKRYVDYRGKGVESGGKKTVLRKRQPFERNNDATFQTARGWKGVVVAVKSGEL